MLPSFKDLNAENTKPSFGDWQIFVQIRSHRRCNDNAGFISTLDYGCAAAKNILNLPS